MGPFLFAEIKTGCRKAQSEGYGSVLERARSTPLRVASPESSAALGRRFRWTAAAEALRVATGKAPPAWLRFASLCAARDSGPLVGRPAMLLWQQRALECAAGPQFAVGHSRTSRYSGRYSSRYSSHYSSRYSRREFGSLKRFL